MERVRREHLGQLVVAALIVAIAFWSAGASVPTALAFAAAGFAMWALLLGAVALADVALDLVAARLARRQVQKAPRPPEPRRWSSFDRALRP